jgi:hypothetical protein
MSNLKAILTFDESWDDEAIRNAFADNDQFPGVIVSEVTSAECGGCARQEIKVAEQTPTNTGSPKLPDWNEVYAYLLTLRPTAEDSLTSNQWFARATYDFIVRQLRAGATVAAVPSAAQQLQAAIGIVRKYSVSTPPMFDHDAFCKYLDILEQRSQPDP